MSPPTAVPGVLWTGLRPRRSLALALGMVGILAVFAVGRASQPAVEGCPFEQTWFDGDQHFWQELRFDPDGTGMWRTGGMASDAPQKRLEFRWQRDPSTVTAVSRGETRTVGYEIERYDDTGTCVLRFDGIFLPDNAQSRYYSDRRYYSNRR